ncbi:MAG: UvrD-helicase domain-containing protein [Flavobacterium sp.]
MNRPAFSIYDASAGSGKTFTLAKEYLKIILTSTSDEAYRHILAITFTNKAVAEMKKRIVAYLHEFASFEGKPTDMMQVVIAETSLDFYQVQEKSRRIIKNIIHNYAAFDVMTIDKFTSKVIRTFAFDLSLSPNFDITLQTEVLLEEAVETLISNAGEDKALTKLLVDFSLEKADDDKSWDIAFDLNTVGKLLINENHRQEIQLLEGKSLEVFETFKTNLFKKRNALEDSIKKYVDIIFEAFEKNNIQRASFSGQYYPKSLEKIQNTFLFPSTKYVTDEQIKVNKTAPNPSEIEALKPFLVEMNLKIYDFIGQRELIQAILKNLTPMSLLQLISKELRQLLNEKNQLSITDFNTIIHNELQNQPAPFIYERIGEYYRHYFIDEFQDTSVLQWNNLIPLINNSLSSEDHYGDRGSLMIVGDPKQSIYRFRGGRAEQLIQLTKEVNPFINPDKKVFYLKTNWRSYDEVIHFNNGFFNYISRFLSNPDYKELYEKHSFQESRGLSGGYVNLQFVEKGKSEEDEEEVTGADRYLLPTLKTIQKCIDQGFEYKDIAILTRKNKVGTLLAGYLVQNEIPVLSSESLMISLSKEVAFLISFLKFIEYTENEEALAEVLYYLGTEHFGKEQVHDFIAEGMTALVNNQLDDWFSEKNLHLSIQGLQRKTLYETVEFLIMKMISFEKRDAYVQDFLDRVLEQEVKNKAGVADFLKFWESQKEKFSISIPQGKNAVTLLTIHKSKGLEFPVVIFPFAEENYSISRKDKLWVTSEIDSEVPKVLIDQKKAVEEYGEEAQTIYLEKREETLLDNINVIYVALTRAVEQLFIISSLNIKDGVPQKNNMSEFFIGYLMKNDVFDINKLEYEFGNPERKSETSKASQEVSDLPVHQYTTSLENLKIATKEGMMWGSERQKAIDYGNLIHKIMSKITIGSEYKNVVATAIAEGFIPKELEDKVVLDVDRIINHPNLNRFFIESNTIYNEREIIVPTSGIYKPDRVEITKDNKAILIDYKTGTENKSHINQLTNYSDLLSQMGFEVSACYLVYLSDPIKIINVAS